MGASNKSQALYLGHKLRSQSKFLKNDPHRLKIQHAIARCRRTIPLNYLPYDTRFLPIIGKKRSHLLLYPLLRYLMAFKGYSLQMRCFFVGLAEWHFFKHIGVVRRYLEPCWEIVLAPLIKCTRNMHGIAFRLLAIITTPKIPHNHCFCYHRLVFKNRKPPNLRAPLPTSRIGGLVRRSAQY